MSTSGHAQKVNSLTAAVQAQAQQKLLRMSDKDMLASLKQQGIGSLEDLASKLVAHIQSIVKAGSTITWDDGGAQICYPYMTYRPHFDKEVLKDFETFARGMVGG